MLNFLVYIALVIVAVYCERSDDHLRVTCGSAIKLTNVENGYKLHSHEVKYGSGSGQQSVTGYPSASDPNSYFVVKKALDQTCQRGEVMQCGDRVRLQHLSSKCYLHSHLHNSPLSNQQEVSCYDGQNLGDEWKLVCVTEKQKSNNTWLRDAQVRLVHVETQGYLHASKQYAYGNPIPGQLEVSAVKSPNKDTLWRAEEGIYYSDNSVMG